MTTERILLWVVSSYVFVLSLAACGTPGTQATVFLDMQRVPPELRDDYESFAVNCSKCHSLARAFNAHVTEASHWDLYVARMMRTAGSAISPNEAPRILRFLYWYTGTYREQMRLDSERHGDAAFAEPPQSAAESLETAVPAATPASPPPAAPVPDPVERNDAQESTPAEAR